MPKSLAELRASRAVALPERTYPLCLAQGLVAEAGSLASEQSDILISEHVQNSDGEAAKKKRLGQPKNPRLVQIEARLEALYEEMREHTGDLLVRAQPSGWWTRWRDEHPARQGPYDEGGRPTVNPVDQAVAQGWCDTSALLADLGRYVVSYNGEPTDAEAWAFIYANAAPGDLKALCTLVVEMQEGSGARAPKASLRPLSSPPTSEPESESPAVSESPKDGS